MVVLVKTKSWLFKRRYDGIAFFKANKKKTHNVFTLQVLI